MRYPRSRGLKAASLRAASRPCGPRANRLGLGHREIIILLHVIARGKIARSPEAELVARYEKRLTWPVKLTELPETGGKIPEPQSPFKAVLLDERGKQLTSKGLAERLSDWQSDGRNVCLVIGGPDGVSDAVKQRADFTWSLPQLTLPHGMARVLLAEQLYRAWSLQTGHPYHRE